MTPESISGELTQISLIFGSNSDIIQRTGNGVIMIMFITVQPVQWQGLVY